MLIFILAFFLSILGFNESYAGDNRGPSAEYHFSLAQAYASDGNPDRAIEEYKLTLMFDANTPLIYTRLAMEYLKKGLFSSAMEACNTALKLDSKFTDAHLILGGLYSASRQDELALVEYDQVLKKDPKNEEAAVYKSQILLESDHAEKARAFLIQFIKGNPDSTASLYYLGKVEEQLEHPKEAVLAYQKAIGLRPGFSQAIMSLGLVYEQQHQDAKAMKLYQGLYDDSQDVLAANRIATIYLKAEKYKESVPYLKTLEAADPDDLNVRVKLGLIEMQMKNYVAAVPIFKKILEKSPDSERIHYYLGNIYEELNQIDQAVAELKTISPQSKLYGDAVLHSTYLLKRAGRTADAKSYLSEAISKSPKVPALASFFLFEASLEEDSKNYTEAVRILEKASKEYPEDERVRYYLGSLYDRQGSIDKGIAQMEEILKLNPENVDALNYIGYTWTQQGVRLNDAEKLLRRALGLRPNNGYVQDSWGWYLYTRGRLQEAVVQLEKAARMKPNEPTIMEHLGDAYLRANLREKALSQYKDAVKFTEDAVIKQKFQLKIENLHREDIKSTARELTEVEKQRAPASQLTAQ